MKWTEDEDGNEIFEPLRTSNVIVRRKDFFVEKAFFQFNAINKLEMVRHAKFFLDFFILMN